MSLEVAMMAMARPQPYAAESLRSMFTEDEIDVPVRVVVCGTDAAFLGPWEEDARVSVEMMSPEAFAVLSDHPRCWRITETFLRCLRPAASRESDLVLFQDDVLLARDWLKTTRSLAARAERIERNRLHRESAAIVLALFCPMKLSSLQGPLAFYQPRKFFGNQGLYLSADAIRALVPFAERHHDQMDDMVLKDFIRSGGARLFAINPNIVQHTGEDSTHGGYFHRSPSFRASGHG